MKIVLMPVLSALLLAYSGAARAQGASPSTFVSDGADQRSSVEPESPPPPPPQQVPPPQQQQQAQVQQPAVAAGQWINTAQYGWVWMPYGAGYIAAATVIGEAPSAYVYHPPHGWTWLAAPWVNGWGESPHFGSQGPSGFAWYHSSFYGGGHHSGGHGGTSVVHGFVGTGHRGAHVSNGQHGGAHGGVQVITGHGGAQVSGGHGGVQVITGHGGGHVSGGHGGAHVSGGHGSRHGVGH